MPLKAHGDCDGWPVCRQRGVTVFKVMDELGLPRAFCRGCWPAYRFGPLEEEQ